MKLMWMRSKINGDRTLWLAKYGILSTYRANDNRLKEGETCFAVGLC